MLSVVDLSHSYGAAQVLRAVSLEIPEASYTVLLGPSGSGKTTLLSAMGGFVTPDAGRIFLSGEDVTRTPPAKRSTATVFQDYALFPHMSIQSNVEFGLRMRGVDRRARRDRALEAMAAVGLDGFEARMPDQLSGGQRQRVALARALVIQPTALLLDEPLGALDLALRRRMQNELKAIQKRVGMTFVHVTHDQEEAMALADQVVVMNAGAIEDVGPPERVYRRPASRFTAQFVGESSILDGVVAASADGRVLVETPIGRIDVAGDAAVGAGVGLAVRPEAIELSAADEERRASLGSARIDDVVFQGGFKRVLATGESGAAWLLKRPMDEAIEPGATVALSARNDDLILLTL